MRKNSSTSVLDDSGHAAVFYDKPDELWQLLARYFRTGFEKDELGILVTHFSPLEVLKGFRSAGLEVSDRVGKGDLRLFNMIGTYLPDGQFVADFMMGNILDFANDATNQGYSGLRTAGEMNWLQDYPQFDDEAKVYESNVSDMANTNPNFTGLCLYAVREDSEDLLANMHEVLETHPNYFYRGKLLKSKAFPV